MCCPGATKSGHLCLAQHTQYEDQLAMLGKHLTSCPTTKAECSQDLATTHNREARTRHANGNFDRSLEHNLRKKNAYVAASNA